MAYLNYKDRLSLPVVLPTTSVGVRELLYWMVLTLREDAARYRKAHKVPDTEPGLADKLDAADAIEKVKIELERRNKERWKKEPPPY